MKSIKLICSLFSILTFSLSILAQGPAPYGTCNGTALQVCSQMFSTSNGCFAVPYINFSAQATVLDGVNYVTAPFYHTWNPDGMGLRGYHTIAFTNPSTTETVSFIFTSTESNEGMTSDNKLWTGSISSPILVDDDGGRWCTPFGGASFGTKVVMPPGTNVSFIISMYSSTTIRPWFGLALIPFSTSNASYYLNSTNYRIVTSTGDGSNPILSRN